MRARPFPWGRAMELGFGVLRLPPDAFWRMTPREFAFALRAVLPPVGTALTRAQFERLRARFPDADARS